MYSSIDSGVATGHENNVAGLCEMSRIIVFSADAMVAEDVEFLKSLPNFQRYLSGGSEIQKVRSIYPTITYAVHTTLATGTYPDRHGIHGNYIFKPGEQKLPWFWFHDAIKVPDIFTAAKKAGLSTAAVFWPVTGNHPDIDYLIDEYWTQGEGDSLHAAFERSGSNPEVLRIVDRHAHILEGKQRQHPASDEFIIACTCDIIREFKPDLLMIHPANIDTYRHNHGLFNDVVQEGIRETDKWIGMLVQAAQDVGVWEDTNFFLISDHGQMEIKRAININVLLADHGLITLEENGRVADWKAYSLSGGMSALIFLKDPENEAVKQQVYRLLCELCEEGIYGIGKVFTKEEVIEQERFGGEFSFVIETDGYTSFGDSPVRPLVRKFDFSDYRFGRATHGYLPEKGPQPVFLAKGPDIQNGVVLENGNIVDEAPTFAKVLGIELPEAEGHVIEGVLKGK